MSFALKLSSAHKTHPERYVGSKTSSIATLQETAEAHRQTEEEEEAQNQTSKYRAGLRFATGAHIEPLHTAEAHRQTEEAQKSDVVMLSWPQILLYLRYFQ